MQGGLPPGLLALEQLRRPRAHMDVSPQNMRASSLDMALATSERQANRAQQEALRHVMTRHRKERSTAQKWATSQTHLMMMHA